MAAGASNRGFSVVIPLYNKVDTVARAVRSALDQRGIDVEVIVVDDGSIDGSVEAAERFGGDILIMRQANAGPAAARNAGARRSVKGNLLFLDADDELPAGSLAAHDQCLAGDPACRVSLASGAVFENGVPGKPTLMASRVDPGSASPFVYTRSFTSAAVKGVPVGAICIRRDVFTQLDGFNPRLRCWEVTDFMFRAALSVPVIGLHRRVGFIEHRSSNSQFGRTMHDPIYRALFAESIVGRLSEVPPDQRAAFAGAIRSGLAASWEAGELDRFRSLAARARRFDREIDLGPRLRVLSRLPEGLLSLVARSSRRLQ